MLKLERLCLAIAEQEGWHTGLTFGPPGGSASYRRQNPGNLRSSPFQVGSEAGFAVFNTSEDGFAALRWDIRQKARGNTSSGLDGNSTLSQLIHIWAPATDGNDPNGYLQSVCKMTGLESTMQLKELL